MNKQQLLQEKIDTELMYMAGVLGATGMSIAQIKHHVKEQGKLLSAAFKKIEDETKLELKKKLFEASTEIDKNMNTKDGLTRPEAFGYFHLLLSVAFAKKGDHGE